MNHLSHETSPYLLQHKDNPVWWYPWGEAAFEKAKKENKPVFLSIGYSTCHWCHVMEKDSFEKSEVASILNAEFISIKVDREERPDVDHFYMNIVVALTGHGGWPMSVILTPDGKAFWGGTFLPKENFCALLKNIAGIWKDKRSEVLESGNKILEFIKDADKTTIQSDSIPELTPKLFETFYFNFKYHFDDVHGGTKGAPKFPPALTLLTLLRFAKDFSDVLEMVEKTLAEMRRGGIFDQLGGGFHRYSVDEAWMIPHFEKMLYDNALMALVNLETFQITKNPELAQTASEIFDYILKDMTSPHGGFYSAEDADSENIEGKFYVWPAEELEAVLTPLELAEVTKLFNVTHKGNFEVHRTGDEVKKEKPAPALTGNVLYVKSEMHLSHLSTPSFLATKEKLLKVRENRERPLLDDKILVSWNGLMIQALAKGFQVLQNQNYLIAAQRAARFILNTMKTPKGRLFRVYRSGHAKVPAMAEDYANLISALIELYQCDFDENWLLEAEALQTAFNQDFFDSTLGGYFDHDGRDKYLVSRNKSFEDNVVPSVNGVAAGNLLKLSSYFGNMDYKRKADGILNLALTHLEKYPRAVPTMIQYLDNELSGFEQWVLVSDGPSTIGDEKIIRWQQTYDPRKIIAYKTGKTGADSKIPLIAEKKTVDSSPTVYVCQNNTCLKPEVLIHS